MRPLTEDKVMKAVAVLCCVIGGAGILYVVLYAQYIFKKPVDVGFFYR